MLLPIFISPGAGAGIPYPLSSSAESVVPRSLRAMIVAIDNGWRMNSRTPGPPGGAAPRGPCWSRCFKGRVRSAGICATGSGMEFPVLLIVMNGIADLRQHVNAVHTIEHLHHLAVA